VSRRSVSLILLSAVLAFSGGIPLARQGGPAWRILFISGSTIDVSSYTVDDGRLVLFLEDGGTFAVSSSQVKRVDRVELPITPDGPEVPAVIPGGSAEAPLVSPEPMPAPAPVAAIPAAPPLRDIDTLVNEAARRYGLEADLLAAVIAVESGYRVNAVSPKGAQGLMQLMPGTARELAVTDAFDPAQNIDAGARHLKRLIESNGGTYWRALAAYNAGEGNVARYKGLPPFRETMSYVRRVLDRYGKPRRGALAPSPRP
jgi:hypothetical protein